MPNKDRPAVGHRAPKHGVGWLINDQQGKVPQFRNDNPTVHSQWVVVSPGQYVAVVSLWLGVLETQMSIMKPVVGDGCKDFLADFDCSGWHVMAEALDYAFRCLMPLAGVLASVALC